MFNPKLLPHVRDFYDDMGLRLNGKGKWRTTCCEFCERRDAMRVNIDTGEFYCRECEISGADVLDYYAAKTGADTAQASNAIGAWVYVPARTATRHLGGRHGI
ncbi:MAG: hypothetical protein KGZ67_05020 [Hydrogenophaga sp.]|jgi:hypothetical protein|nr:hypothetical protein [Hydrogenophaga sp.]